MGEARPQVSSTSALEGLIESLVDAAVVVAVWAGLLVAENTALAFLWPQQFSGAWEISLARYRIVPLAVVALAPASLIAVGGWSLAKQAAVSERASAYRVVLAVAGAAAAAALALGVSTGRHMASWAVRAPFALALASVGAASGARGVARLTSLDRTPSLLAALGLTLSVGAWLSDGYVLPRLYPAFHTALFLLVLLGGALVAFAARSDVLSPGPVAHGVALAVAAGLVLCAASVPKGMAALDRASNLRIVLVEHAPLLGRVVAARARFRPGQEPDDALAPAGDSMAPTQEVRSLDWTGRDFLLLTVDALRADHVSSYGYGRPTTPNIDALAREGARFEHAYCPTPHTSYSVTSMMTGKYLRPLLALGMGQDSETWADYVRRYGWRTAAFYPPAVFFIDESRFSLFEDHHLGFEYAKVEFADPALRERQVAAYLEGAPVDRPLLLWVHFFEPHEPYVMHDAHPFAGGPSPDIDAYDSEVATADDGIGRVVSLVRRRRPGAVVVVTADHGEEFGEHGGRYHGTTVYEEQVRVPMVVVAPGVAAGTRVDTVAQTIDLLPTTLSALGIPRPARLRGRDLSRVLAYSPAPPPPKAGNDGRPDPGLAVAETDDYALLARGDDRLVCHRRAAACALYRLDRDPLEQHDVAADDPLQVARMRAGLREIERDHGKYEGAGGPVWPEALRRGIQGDADTAADVASLLDDADVAIRRKAAEVCFELHAAETLPGVKRAFSRDEDEEVRRWSALAMVRMGEAVPPLAESLLHDPQAAWRRPAALAIAGRGDSGACDEIAAWWREVAPSAAEGRDDGEPPQVSLDLPRVEELLDATVKGRCRGAIGTLVRILQDVRARPHVADALGALGDAQARAPLLSLVADEPNVTSRQHEASALRALGVSADLIDRPRSRR